MGRLSSFTSTVTSSAFNSNISAHKGNWMFLFTFFLPTLLLCLSNSRLFLFRGAIVHTRRVPNCSENFLEMISVLSEDRLIESQSQQDRSYCIEIYSLIKSDDYFVSCGELRHWQSAIKLAFEMNTPHSFLSNKAMFI